MISHEKLKRILNYDKDTGHFTWLVKTSRKVVAGKIAGGTNVAGYTVIGVGGKTYYAHRLAWFYVTGSWPDQIDHSNGDRSDNSWKNLREATYQQNILNSKLAAHNTSGFKGVSWHRGAGKWSAQIVLDGIQKYLGLYETPQEAAAAYMNAALIAQPEFARER